MSTITMDPDTIRRRQRIGPEHGDVLARTLRYRTATTGWVEAERHVSIVTDIAVTRHDRGEAEAAW